MVIWKRVLFAKSAESLCESDLTSTLPGSASKTSMSTRRIIFSFPLFGFLATPSLAATDISIDPGLNRSATATIVPLSGGFDRPLCYQTTLDLLDNHTPAYDDDRFYHDAAGRTLSSPEDLTLTVSGCEEICGPEQGWYRDIGPRLVNWLIPVLLLISNVELSPLDKRRFLAILHLLGDPIDSMWSMIDKLDSWDQCYRLAERYGGACSRCNRIIATVLAGFEEVQGPRFHSQADYVALVEQHDFANEYQEWRRTAVLLADSRTDEFARTCLAIILYMFQLVASFVSEVGGGSNSPPGGRIATGVFLSWLIPVALMSNAMGNFTSRRTCYEIMSDFAKRTGEPLQIRSSRSVLLPGVRFLSRSSSTNYNDSLSWSGGLHTFRPWKRLGTNTAERQPRASAVLLLAILPICVSFLGGFIILWWSLPTGFNCRHTWLIGIFLAWITSAYLTRLSYLPNIATGNFHWRFTLAKDALIAGPSILVIFLSACGLYNYCKCWGGFLRGRKHGRILLSSDAYYIHNDHSVYPIVVGICTFLQLVVFSSIVLIWRRGLRLFRWSENARHEEWEQAAD